VNGKQALALALIICTMSVPLVYVARGQSGLPVPVVSLGFNQQYLVPVTQLIPVYTLGDQMWISVSNVGISEVRLYSPSGAFSEIDNLNPSEIALLHVFDSTDEPGTWTVQLYGAFVFQSLSVQVVAPGGPNPPSTPTITSSTVASNGSLSISLKMNPHDAFNLQGCVLGGSGNLAKFVLPKQVGNYSLGLFVNGSSLVGVFSPIPGQSLTPPPFDMWAELGYTYSYSSPNDTHQLVNVEETAAATPKTSFSSPLPTGNFSLPLQPGSNLPVGRYSLYLYLRNSVGLFVQQTTVLVTGRAQWVWFGACSRLFSPSPESVVDIPLGSSSAAWPTSVIVAYRNNGTEGFIQSPIRTNLTAVRITASPWGVGLPSQYSVRLVPNSAVSSFQVFNDTAYLQFSSFPTTFHLQVLFQGKVVEETSFNQSSQYQALDWLAPIGKLQVAVQLDSAPLAGVRVNVYGNSSLVGSQTTGGTGTASFLLPGGNYTVAVVSGNSTTSQPASVNLGRETTALFSLASQKDYTPEYALLAVAGAGAAANIIVWRRFLRRSP
jgi:hypothetical protein